MGNIITAGRGERPAWLEASRAPAPNVIDRVIRYFAPRAGLQRIRARQAAELLLRNYEAASTGRRTQGWKRTSTDATAAAGAALGTLRDVARDLVRNNGYAESALTTICDNVVGDGIVAKATVKNVKAEQLWKEWADTTACDADGKQTFSGLQHLALRTVAESGEVLVRRRIRRPEDGLPLPIQIQVLEPDYLDTQKTGQKLPNGGRILRGVEFDAIGRRVAYWLFPEHPGSEMAVGNASVRVPAESVLHVFRQDRAGQVRGVSWFSPVLLRFKDLDDYEDASMMKQRIAACLAVIITDPDGTSSPLGTVDTTAPTIDQLEPGMILNRGGSSVEVIQPPSVGEYGDFTKAQLRAIATGLGVTYEDLTGDYSQVNFSSGRMGRLRHWRRVSGWRWRMLIPQFCDPVWGWAMEAAGIMGSGAPSAAAWTGEPMPMTDPNTEILAIVREVRSGLKSLSEALRERGYDPQEVLREIADDNKLIDELGLVLDSDPRTTTQAGQPVDPGAGQEPPRPDDDAAGKAAA